MGSHKRLNRMCIDSGIKADTHHTAGRDSTFNCNKDAASAHYQSFQSVDEAYVAERLALISIPGKPSLDSAVLEQGLVVL